MDYNRFKNFNRSRAEAHNQLAFSSAKEAYYRQMTNAQVNLNPNEFEQEHLKCKSAALEQFTNQCKNCVDTFSETYRNKLEKVSVLLVYSQFSILPAFLTCRVYIENCVCFFFISQEIEMDRKWFKAHNESITNAARAVAIRKEVRTMDIVRDMFSGGTAGAVVIGTAVGGPAGALFGALWGAFMGRGIGAWARKK